MTYIENTVCNKNEVLCDIWLGDIFFQITAPEDGYIKQRNFKAGDLISNADTLAYFIASKNITMSDSVCYTSFW